MTSGCFKRLLFVLIAAFLVVSVNSTGNAYAGASAGASASASGSASSSAVSWSNAFAGSLAGSGPTNFQLEGHKGIRSYDSAAYSGYNGPTNEEGHFGHPAGAAGSRNNGKPDTAASRRSNCAKCKWEDDEYWEKEEPEEPEEEEERDWDECDDHDDGQYHPEKSHPANHGPQKIGGLPPKINPLPSQPASNPLGSINNHPDSYVSPAYPSVKGGAAPDYNQNHPGSYVPPAYPSVKGGAAPDFNSNHPGSYAPPAYPSVKGGAAPDYNPNQPGSYVPPAYPSVKGGAAPDFNSNHPGSYVPPAYPSVKGGAAPDFNQNHPGSYVPPAYPSVKGGAAPDYNPNQPGSYVPPAYPSVKGGALPGFKPAANHPPLEDNPAKSSTPSYPVGSYTNRPSSYGPPAYPSTKGSAIPGFKPAANHPPLEDNPPKSSTPSYPVGSFTNRPSSYGPPAYPSTKGSAIPDFKPTVNHPPIPEGHSTPSTPAAPWNNGISSSTVGYTGTVYSRPKTPTSWNPLGLRPNSARTTTPFPPRATASTPGYSNPWSSASTASSAASFPSTPSVKQTSRWPSGQTTGPGNQPAKPTIQHEFGKPASPVPVSIGYGQTAPTLTSPSHQFGTSSAAPAWTTRGSPTVTISPTTPRPYWNNPTANANSPCTSAGQNSPCGGGAGPGKYEPPTKIGNNANVASGYPDPTGYKPPCSDGQPGGSGGCVPGKPAPAPQPEGQWPKPNYGSPPLPFQPSAPGAYPRYPENGAPPREGTPSGKPDGFPGAPIPPHHTPINTSPSAFYPGIGAQTKGGTPSGKPNQVPAPASPAYPTPINNSPSVFYPAINNQPIPSGSGYSPSAPDDKDYPQGGGGKAVPPTGNGGYYPNSPGHLPNLSGQPRPSASGPTYYPTASNNPYNPLQNNPKGANSPFPPTVNGQPQYTPPIIPSASGIGSSGPVANPASDISGAAPEYPSRGRSCNCGGSTSTTPSSPQDGGFPNQMSGCNGQSGGCSNGCGASAQLGCQNGGGSKIEKVPAPSLDNNAFPINNGGGSDINAPTTNPQHPGSGFPSEGPSVSQPSPSEPSGQGGYNWNPFLTGKIPAPGLAGLNTDASYPGSSGSAPATIGKGNPFLEGGVHGPSSNSWGNSKPGYDSDKTPPKPAPNKPIGEGNPFFQKGSGTGGFGVSPTINANPAGGLNFGTPSVNPAFENQVPLEDNSFSGPGDAKKGGGIPGSTGFGTGSFPPADKGRNLVKNPWYPTAGNAAIPTSDFNPAGFGSSNGFAGAFSSAAASSSSSAGGNGGSLSFAGSGAAALAQPPFGQINTAHDWSAQKANQRPITDTGSNTNPWASSGSSAYASASSWAGASAGHY